MTKNEIIKQVCGKTGMSGKAGKYAVESVFQVICEELDVIERIWISDFGTLEIRRGKANVSR